AHLCTPTYTLSLHDALPISGRYDASGLKGGRVSRSRSLQLPRHPRERGDPLAGGVHARDQIPAFAGMTKRVWPFSRPCQHRREKDRKSTRLNSSHVKISYAV